MRSLHTLWLTALISTTISLAGSPAATAGAPGAVDETQHTEAALRAIVEHWTEAEVSGDVAYLDQLLAPEYRSINAKGVSLVRATLLDHARRNTGSAEARKRVEDWKRDHPTDERVTIHGDVAIVSYFDPKLGADSSIRGGDVFVYEGHRWRAIYSLHNGA
jgi:hypothetical protein